MLLINLRFRHGHQIGRSLSLSWPILTILTSPRHCSFFPKSIYKINTREIIFLHMVCTSTFT
jgi:hypothetical protein